MKRSSFTTSAVRDFLNCGWMFSLDSKQIFVGWGETYEASEPLPDDAGAASLFAPDFYLHTQVPWRVGGSWDLLNRDQFVSIVLAGLHGNVNAQLQGFQWVEPSEEIFRKRFEIIRKHFAEEGLEKAVPVVFAEAQGDLGGERKAGILLKLLRPADPESFFGRLHPYGHWRSGSTFCEGMIGVSPEILFSKLGSELETVALAGTVARGEGTPETLMVDLKERHEHQLVVDDLLTVLGRLGKVTCGNTGVLELPSLLHLRTPLRVELERRWRFEDLVKALHPTPALGVAPRAKGFAEIRRWDDPTVRGRFGAPFGIVARLEDGREIGKCLVAIRNVQWQDQVIRLGSGCGIVPESEPAREWRELQAKRDSVKRMLGI